MWWAADQHRLQKERLAIDALDADWFQAPDWSFGDKLNLELTFNVVLARGTFALKLIYHSTFPASPPSVRPADGETRLSDHQYGAGGDLCLDIRNDNWTPDVTGADMIESARRLLEEEAPDADGQSVSAPSAHDFPLVMHLRQETRRFYIDPFSRITLFGEGIDGKSVKLGVDYRSGESVVAYLFEIEGDKDTLQPNTPKMLEETSWVMDGQVFCLDMKSPAIWKIKTQAELEAMLPEPIDFTDRDVFGVILTGSDNLHTLFIVHRDREQPWRYEPVYAPFDTRRSEGDVTQISQKRVGIVGLGSVGSKVATSLARAGVRSFDLVDPDILHTGNLERHDGDWRDIGRHKADITERRLRLIHKEIKVRARRSAIGAQISSQEAANINQALAACDLLIDASGNPDVFNHVSGLAVRHNRDLIWGSVFAGGVGGEVARARVDKDPSPYDIRGALNAYYQTADSPAPISSGRGYDGSVGEETPMVASDADVGRIANDLTGLALDTLFETEPSSYAEHAYLIGFRRAWLFDGPFDTHPVLADAPIRTASSSPEGPGIESEFITTLLDKAVDETED